MSSESNSSFDATVLITTRNRRDELTKALTSAMTQVGCLIEILVIDDGSTDGTSDMVRADFPSVRLERCEQSLGLIVQRNRGVNMARSPIVISMDDDAAFSSPHIVAETGKRFGASDVGAVAIPFVNVRYDQTIRQIAPAGETTYVIESFIGTAHAVRRDLFLRLGGYREQLFHQCEEEDYCIRMLDAGYFVAAGRGDPIHHFESPRRDLERIVVYNARNHILFAWQNIPMPYCPAHLLVTMINLLRFGIRRRRVGWTLRGIADGWGQVLRRPFDRRPVARRSYRLSRWLKKSGPVSIAAAREKI